MSIPGGCDDCASARAQLEAFVDRELTDADMAEVRRHLDACPDCHLCFDFQDHVKLLVRRKGCPEVAPSGLAERILSRVRPTEH